MSRLFSHPSFTFSNFIEYTWDDIASDTVESLIEVHDCFLVPFVIGESESEVETTERHVGFYMIEQFGTAEVHDYASGIEVSDG